MKNNNFIVETDDILFSFLKSKLLNKSKNNIKALLSNRHVYVNDCLIKNYNYNLKKGDLVSIKTTSFFDKDINKNIKIIYEDDNIIVVDKPSKILSISTNKEKNITMYHIVSNYLKNKNNKVFIIHRLDKDTSGILMFAKNEKIKNLFQKNWNNIVINRCYYAVVKGKMKNKSGVIKSYLIEDKNYMVHSTNKKLGKIAITMYSVLKNNDRYSLLDINIKTGRKNQIRVHMKENNTPILGDTKYSVKDKNIKRMYLHAYKLEIIDPITNKIINFKTDMPNEFKTLF